MKATMVFFMICGIFFPVELYNIHFFCPANLYILSHQILYYSVFQFTNFAPPFSQPILPSSFLAIFSFEIWFSLQIQNVSIPQFTISPASTHSKQIFLVRGHFTSFCPALKVPTFFLHLQHTFLVGCGQASCCCIVFLRLSLELL